jgi:hypothetical protein
MKDHAISYTTNAEDQAAVDALKNQISQTNQLSRNKPLYTSSSFTAVPNVAIAPGAHKYVLISADEPNANSNESVYFVTSKKGAHYHRNAAEPYVTLLQERGYNNIQVLGGGRIYMNDLEKKIEIFGYS